MASPVRKIGFLLFLAAAAVPVVYFVFFASPSDSEGPERAIADRLDAITALEKAPDFENAAEVVGQYREFMAKYAGRRWELEAHKRMTAYRARADTAARQILDLIRKAEPDLPPAGQLEAYRKFPAKFLSTTDSGEEVRAKIAHLSARMRAAYAREKAEAVKLLEEGRFDEALARVAAMELQAEEERREEVAALRARVERERRGSGDRRRREIADEYLKRDAPFKAEMARGDPRAAAGVVREFLGRAWKDEEKAFVLAPGADYGALLKAVDEWRPEAVPALVDPWVPDAETPAGLATPHVALLDLRNAALVALFRRDLEAAYPAAVASGEELELPSLGKGRFEKREGKTVFVADGRVVEEAVLAPEDLAALAMGRGPADVSMHSRVGFYFYYTGKDGYAKASEHLARARDLGARGVRVYLADLVVLEQKERQRDLEAKLGAAETYASRRQWSPAKTMLDQILRYPDHPFTMSRRPAIEKLLYEATEALRAERRFSEIYLGRVEERQGGALRVTYDFQDRGQMDAFEPVAEEGARKFKGRWRVERGALESDHASSALRWRHRVKGDVTVEYDVMAAEEPQNIVLDLYHNRGRNEHYAVVLAFDWLGRSDGDRDNTAEDRFGMPRTCVLRYPVDVDRTRADNAAEWEKWKARLAGKPVEPWKPVRWESATIRVERAGKSIRVHAGKKLVWEGEDAAYGEGDLVFFSDCRCMVDNLAITFTPAAK